MGLTTISIGLLYLLAKALFIIYVSSDPLEPSEFLHLTEIVVEERTAHATDCIKALDLYIVKTKTVHLCHALLSYSTFTVFFLSLVIIQRFSRLASRIHRKVPTRSSAEDLLIWQIKDLLNVRLELMKIRDELSFDCYSSILW